MGIIRVPGNFIPDYLKGIIRFPDSPGLVVPEMSMVSFSIWCVFYDEVLQGYTADVILQWEIIVDHIFPLTSFITRELFGLSNHSLMSVEGYM